MREIWFRGKLVNDDDWAEGYYVRLYGSNGKVSRRIYTGCAEVDCGDYYPDYFEVIPTTVGQYTGLKDKNGKRIFEGDLCLCNRNINDRLNKMVFEIKYNPEDGFFGESYISEINADQFYMCEIVGNIHDNPELVKEDK